MKKNLLTTISSPAARVQIARCLEGAEMSASNVAELRLGLSDLPLGVRDVEMLFALDRSGIAACPEWTSFFVEAVTDYIVWQARPTGVVDEAQAEWLIGQVDRAKTLAAFATLVNVLAEADRVPAWLAPAARTRAADWPNIAGAIAASQAQQAA
jgi:hypothetical protein